MTPMVNTNDGKIPPELRDIFNEKHEQYFETQQIIGDYLNNYKKGLVREYRETVRDMAIVSGAIATFSLHLFSSQDNITWVSTLGITLLLINVMLAFAHLIGTFNLENDKIEKHKEYFLRDVQEMVATGVKVSRGEESFDCWLKEDTDFQNKYSEYQEKLKKLSKEENESSYMDKILVFIFVVAMSFIIYSLIEPYNEIIGLTLFYK